jgi:hypothetical protein
VLDTGVGREVRDDDALDDGDGPLPAGGRADPAGVATWRRHLASDAAVLARVREELAAELAARP